MSIINKRLNFVLLLLLSLIIILGYFIHDGIYSNASSNIDTDGDGISDTYELNGLDINGDGKKDLDLKKLGANRESKDVFVEVDFMKGFKPIDDSIKNVIQVFKNHGINLHIIIDEEIPYQEYSSIHEMDNKKYFGSKIERLPQNLNLLKAKSLIFHYSTFIDKITEAPSVSGYGIIASKLQNSEYPKGLWHTISLGPLRDIGRPITMPIQAGTFMHELGHNLGLDHGGIDDLKYKPNYFSVMNYLFQFGVIPRDLDYSNCDDVSPLNEKSLNEFQGIVDRCKPSRISAYYTERNCLSHSPTDELRIIPTNNKINWNDKNSYESNIKFDLNCDGKKILLETIDDWDFLCYVSYCKHFSSNLEESLDENVTEEVNTTSFTKEMILQQLKDETPVNTILDLQDASIRYINDTLNSLPESAFESQTQDSNLMSESEEFPVNEVFLKKQLFSDWLGVNSNKNISSDDSFLEGLSEIDNINVTKSIENNNIDEAIDNLEKIKQFTDSYLNKTGEDDLIVGEENQKLLGDSIQNAIESLKVSSCTYAKCLEPE